MKLKLLLTVLIVLISFVSWGQDKNEEEKPKGKITGKVFANYHFDASSDEEQTSAFELTRVYLGYKYKFNSKFSATILLDAGKGSDGSDYSVFVKNAKLDYKAADWLTLSGGMFGMKQFKDQEVFWGYRYIYKSLDDEYKFGSSADLGAMAAFKVAKGLTLDLLVVNGEGYKKLQDPKGKNRYGANLVYKPNSNIILKAYYDTMKGIDVDDEDENTIVNNIALFAGYTIKDKFRIGAEYNMLQNGETYKKAAKGKDREGLSFYSTYVINEKWNVFGRYDDVSSNTLEGEMMAWNYMDDGNTIIGGVEFKPTKNVNTSINYRHTDYEDTDNGEDSYVYVNLEFKF